MQNFLLWFAGAALVAGGLVTGLLFAFANFVMQALRDLPDEHAALAMQRINVRILNPLFFVLFFGAPLSSVLSLWVTVRSLESAGHGLIALGAAAYLVGPFGITAARNVPLNNRLESLGKAEAAVFWPEYQRRWQTWNHIRTALGVLAMILLVLGLSRVTTP